MRIAFVGKGGSGKSTISSLFILHLIQKHKRAIVIDADLNIHLPELLGIQINKEKALSLTENAQQIRTFLKGESKRIKNIDHFYKTTPPSCGVNFLDTNPQNFILKNFFEKISDNAYLATVGTYEKGGIGISCYHTNLSIFENLLSFSNIKKDEWIVADMVAGIDAFSNTLYSQFDILLLVIEPTTESINVYKQYKELAEHVKVNNNLFVVANKIEDENDIEFINSKIESKKILGYLRNNRNLKKSRQSGESISLELLESSDKKVLDNIQDCVEKHFISPNDKLKTLQQLHLRYIQQDYVKNAVGDISDQIDTEFKHDEA
jgi:CO dehydrogenase maturation factor